MFVRRVVFLLFVCFLLVYEEVWVCFWWFFVYGVFVGFGVLVWCVVEDEVVIFEGWYVSEEFVVLGDLVDVGFYDV